MNREIPESVPEFEAGEELPIECGAPSMEEIRTAIKFMKNKVAGCDGIPAEFGRERGNVGQTFQ